MSKAPEQIATTDRPHNPQLPEEMQDCFIEFRECSFGHGWLTARNWVDHPCPTCQIEQLRIRVLRMEGMLMAKNEIIATVRRVISNG